MPSFTTLQELIVSLAQGGRETALVGFQKERVQSYTFVELADLARRLARGLLDAGLEANADALHDRVAKLADDYKEP